MESTLESAPVRASRAPPGIRASRAPPGIRASRVPPRACTSRGPPRARASRAPPRACAARVPPRAHAARAPPRDHASRVPPRACAARAPTRPRASRAPPRAHSSYMPAGWSPYFPQGFFLGGGSRAPAVEAEWVVGAVARRQTHHGCPSPLTRHGSWNGHRPGGLLSAHPPFPLDGVCRMAFLS